MDVILSCERDIERECEATSGVGPTIFNHAEGGPLQGCNEVDDQQRRCVGRSEEDSMWVVISNAHSELKLLATKACSRGRCRTTETKIGREDCSDAVNIL